LKEGLFLQSEIYNMKQRARIEAIHNPLSITNSRLRRHDAFPHLLHKTTTVSHAGFVTASGSNNRLKNEAKVWKIGFQSWKHLRTRPQREFYKS